jgi:NADH-ubiquinone oxidoreductase chain 5
MEGPTPVSALLHAATMVTAGIILLIRCSSVMSYFPSILITITIFGSLTACMAAFASVFQTDIKKVIAYSTCSQLGYMVMACGLSYYNVALFHLFNHAFFKALLFLGAGSIIHAVTDEQDMRRLGGLFNFLPFTFFSMLIGSLAIMGIPFFAGFYSKDLILELTYSTYAINATTLYFLAVFAAFCTAVYSIRLLLFVFFFKPKFFHVIAPEEASVSMTAAMFILFILSIIVGYLFCDLFIGLGSSLLSETVTYLPLNYYFNNQFLVNPFIKNLPLITTIFGCILGLILITFINLNVRFKKNIYYSFLKVTQRISALSYNALYFNIIYNDLFINSYIYSYTINTKLIDKGIYEYLGPVGIYRTIYNFSNQVKAVPPSVFLSLGFMFFGLIIIYFYLILANYALSFYLFHFGMFINLTVIIYNEYTTN